MKSALCAAIPRIASGLSTEGQRSGNQARARETRRVPMDQERPARSRDDCVGAALRDDVIAGPILMPVYVYLPSSTKPSSTSVTSVKLVEIRH